MKNLLLPLILLLGLSLLTTSCNDDDDGPRANTVQVNGATETLTQALLEEYGDNGNGSFDWDVTLITDGFDLVNNTGAGSILYLDLNSSSEDGLVSGTYNWSQDREAFTIVDGSMVLAYDLVAESYDYSMEATDGTVVINVGDTETEIDVTMTMQDGETLNAYYKGALTPF